MSPPISSRPTGLPPHPGWYPVLGAFVVALVGYFGGWIWHRAAGLVITGVDMAEYVKFLPPVRAGQIDVLRESFYAPLAMGSLIAGLSASRRVLPLWLRWLAGISVIPLALAMLPPAWSPGVLAMPEFRLQVIALVACIAALSLLLVTRFLPDAITLPIVALLALIAAIWPAANFLAVLAPIEELYLTAIRPGWGFWVSTVGFLLTAVLSIYALIPRRPRRQILG